MASLPNILWDMPPKKSDLSASDVHIWCFPLDLKPIGTHLLSPREVARAKAFAFDIHRVRYIAAHTALRQILARYTEIEPGRLVFSETNRGKPLLVQESQYPPLFFNLSHSESLGLLAVAREAEIGADIEFMRPIPDMISIANRFFCAAETQKLATLPTEQQTLAFFSCWTRKEACLKATGDGITNFLSTTEVTLLPHEECRLLKLAGNTDEANNWKIESFNPAPGYIAAMAVRATNPYSHCWRWVF